MELSSKILEQTKCPKCPSSDAYTIYGDGHAHCFSCGYHVRGDMTIEMIKSSINNSKSSEINTVSLPSDFDKNYIPDEPREWLYRYQINDTEIRRNNIGWSERRKFLIFPVFGALSDPLMYQARYFGEIECFPKWKTVGLKTSIIHLPEDWPQSTIVIVEDVVSAIKVSRVTNCVPLFGSDMSTAMATRLTKLFKKGRVWLDADKQRTSLETALKLSELGMPTVPIFTQYDPKEFVTADIRRIVDPLGD